jgi:hypothetical protein
VALVRLEIQTVEPVGHLLSEALLPHPVELVA